MERSRANGALIGARRSGDAVASAFLGLTAANAVPEYSLPEASLLLSLLLQYLNTIGW